MPSDDNRIMKHLLRMIALTFSLADCKEYASQIGQLHSALCSFPDYVFTPHKYTVNDGYCSEIQYI